MSDPTNPKRRIVELDALRALAAINLMLFHFTHVYSVKFGYSTPLGFEFPWGKYGVQLFFMLSGLVNAMTLLARDQPGQFLSSRIWRILPGYQLAIAVNLLLLGFAPLAFHPTWTATQLLANLTMMPNLLGEACLDPVLWTLQIEVLFYGILLFLYWQGWLQRPLRIVMAGLGICLAGCWAHNAMMVADPVGPATVAAGFLRQLLLLDHFPLFAVGILLHELWRNPSGRGWQLAGIAASLAVFHGIDQHHHNPVVSLGLTGLLAMALTGWAPWLRWRPLVAFSSLSYMIFLFHNPTGVVAIWWMDQAAGIPPSLCLMLALVLATLVAWVMTRWVEPAVRQRMQGLVSRLAFAMQSTWRSGLRFNSGNLQEQRR